MNQIYHAWSTPPFQKMHDRRRDPAYTGHMGHSSQNRISCWWDQVVKECGILECKWYNWMYIAIYTWGCKRNSQKSTLRFQYSQLNSCCRTWFNRFKEAFAEGTWFFGDVCRLLRSGITSILMSSEMRLAGTERWNRYDVRNILQSFICDTPRHLM